MISDDDANFSPTNNGEVHTDWKWETLLVSILISASVIPCWWMSLKFRKMNCNFCSLSSCNVGIKILESIEKKNLQDILNKKKNRKQQNENILSLLGEKCNQQCLFNMGNGNQEFDYVKATKLCCC